MKKIFLSIITLIVTFNANSQSTVGLMAHWDFNGTTNDVSGNGHNGHGNNITSAVGMDGSAGHGYYFNGSNSSVTVPYSSSFNINKYSICATIKVQGFYGGTCHANTILTRGAVHTAAGIYTLYFCDQPTTGSCTSLDTTKDVFCANAGLNVQSSFSLFDYTPRIVENTWYKVVATYDSMTWKVYVNGILKTSTNAYGTILPIGSTSDSISIGMDVFQASSGYPFNFKGVIDDIMLYNRALSDTEVAHYGDTCGKITSDPVNVNTHVGGTVIYSIASSIASASYQWQMDGGTGFVNLTNSGPYSGVFTPTLTVTGVSTSIVGNHFRCLVSNSAGCNDTSTQALLTTGLKSFDISNSMSIYPNPFVDQLSILLPDGILCAKVQIFNQLGTLVRIEELNNTKASLNLNELPIGVYYIKVISKEASGYRIIVKS